MKQSHLQAYFFDPPRGFLAKNVVWKYGMLSLICGLLALQIWLFASISPGYPYERYAGFVTVTILLLNHLSAFFYFGPRFTFPFRLFSAAFLILGSVYILWTLFVATKS